MRKEIICIRSVTLICFAFGVLGIAFALASGSSSMMFDGLYSMVQSIFILLSGSVVRLIGRRDDEYYQFGYGAYEPFYIVIRTMVLLTMNAALAYRAFISLFTGGRVVEASLGLIFTLISIIGCLGVYIFLRAMAKELGSPILRAESRSWLNDILISVSVLISFALMEVLFRLGYDFIAVMIDPCITVLFAVVLAPSLIKQLVSAVRDLLDAAPPKEIQERLETVVEKYSRVYYFRDYLIYAAKRGRTVSSTIHVILREDISVSRIDRIRKEMLREIKESWPWSDTDIVFTVDPSWMEYAVPSPEGSEMLG